MPKFSKRSKDNLATCHPDLQKIANEAIKIIDFTVICGHRPKADQDAAVAAGFSKTKWPNSKHNSTPSMAMDIIPYPFKGWNEYKQFLYLGGAIIATARLMYLYGEIEHQLRWGHDWDKDDDLGDQTFNDSPHFELYK